MNRPLNPAPPPFGGAAFPPPPPRFPRRPPTVAHSRWELLFWVVAAGLAGALVMLLFLPDRLRAVGGPPPVRTPRLVHANDAPTKKNVTSDDAESDDEAAEPAADRESTGEEPTRRDLEAGMAKVQSRALACRENDPFVGLLQVKVTIARSGGVQSATVLPPNHDLSFASCVAHAAQSATFAHFRGVLHPTVELIYPFYFPPQ